MEKRIAKVNISSAGGTAATGARTFKVTLPNSWMDELDVGSGKRELELTFDGKQIVISRCLTCGEFVARKLEQKHDVRLFLFYDGKELCTTIHADFDDRTLVAENKTADPVKTAFGNKTLPSWEDFQAFLEDRCIPRERAGLKEYLETIGVGGYDPLEIVAKTAGRMAEDNQWLKVEALR
jgi:hypothetical protein